MHVYLRQQHLDDLQSKKKQANEFGKTGRWCGMHNEALDRLNWAHCYDLKFLVKGSEIFHELLDTLGSLCGHVGNHVGNHMR